MHTGYYSLVQYCPDRSRLEVANVGVLLFVPAARFLRVRFASGNDRIRRFFQEEIGDLAQLNLIKRLLEHRIEDEASGVGTLDELRHLQSRFANELLFTDPRPVRVENPEVELTQLFEELVGAGRVRRDPPAEPRIIETLRARLETPEFARLVSKQTRSTVPVLGEELVANYSFQNGRLNLIQAHEFAQPRPADVLRDVMRTAVNGHLLFKHADPVQGERQLVIVGTLGPAANEQRDKIQALLADHEVTLYTPDTVERLVTRIRQTAH